MWDIFTESAVGRAITTLSPSALDLTVREATTNDDASDITTTEKNAKHPLMPINWSLAKKNWVLAQICLLTWSVYAGSAIYTPGVEQLSQDFHVGSVTVTLGLTLFVIGYSLGPVLFTIFSEDPRYGRTPVLIGTLFAFLLLQVGCALVTNLPGLLILRFLSGFFGSPALAIPANMIFDMYPPTQIAYAIAAWGCAASAGPTMGPLMSGYAVQIEGWRWSFWILLWMSGLSLAILSFFLPETLPSNIKLRRLKMCEKEKNEINQVTSSKWEDFNKMGLTIMKLNFLEPIAFSLNMYIALLYGILYIWFESFPAVYIETYGFNIGEMGIAFLGLACGVGVAVIGYFIYIAKYINPRIIKHGKIDPVEDRLHAAFITSFALPICLFMFGWSAGRTHWIVPTIATGFFGIAIFLAFQSVIIYLGDCYAVNAPASMAGNALIRGIFGSAFPLFGRALFSTLGVDWGNSLLGFIAVAFAPIPFVLYRYGKELRRRSPLALHSESNDDVESKLHSHEEALNDV